MKTISRYIMTLALLLTAVTGAWAQSTLNVVELEVPANWEGDNSNVTAADLTGFKASTLDEAQAWTGAPAEGMALLIYAFDGEQACLVPFTNGKAGDGIQDTNPKHQIFGTKSVIKYYYTYASDAIEVTPGSSANTWTFSMPGSDVVLTPIYAKAATFATTGTEPEATTLLPAAAEGVIAGTDASLIAEGTGIVAFAGTSTEVTQGTLMYAVGNSDTQAPALTAFSATAPTAKDVADDGATVYVWYYIKGADAPDGDAATLDNTFDDTEPVCLTVTVLTNKFDITLKAANANTIEAGNATVTVGGTPATVTDGKLQGVKMGSEVKLEANPGYKFRKVEVKKGAATVPVTAITLNKTATTISVGSTETLSVTSVTPDNATDQTVTWSSDNEAVATVNATTGEVTAVALGTANITATANDGSGVTATCAVTVNKVVTINQSDWAWSSSFTKDGVTVSAGMIDPMDGNLMDGGTFSTTLGNFTKIVVTTHGYYASGTGWSGGTWAGTPASTVSFSGDFMGLGQTQTTIVCTIAPTN